MPENLASLWITGTTKTGKTSRLIAEFSKWVRKQLTSANQSSLKPNLSATALVLAANNQNRRVLSDRLAAAVEGTYPVICKTPVGFISDEVELFWPLIFEQLEIKPQFPLILRPETEQELATQLWREHPQWDILTQTTPEYQLVRETLDLLQLAGASGIAAEDIPFILEQGLGNLTAAAVKLALLRGELILHWRNWALQRGLLSYGMIYALYWRYLLPNAQYQHHLVRRYPAVFADDTDDYPAIARNLGEILLDAGATGIFTYNPQGKVRLGLNADPSYWEQLSERCLVETLTIPPTHLVTAELTTNLVELVTTTAYGTEIPDYIQSIQTISRAELLRQTAAYIIHLVKNQLVAPEDMAIIAPGLDEIARYTLIEILAANGIAVEPVNEQRPLISSPLVRALLTLMALVYPGIGRLLDRDSIAEMLTILSQKPEADKLVSQIDPVRAGLLADYCYNVDPEQPDLLSIDSFPRWDRIGHQAATAYQHIREWINSIRLQQHQQCFLTPTIFLHQAIEYFIDPNKSYSYEQLSALRKLMETVKHYWEVDRRLKQTEPSFQSQAVTVAQFIQLLRRGTITANPRPIRQFPPQKGAISLATIFQYRSLKSSHSWQFWLDAGSYLWEKGGAATLFAAPLFLKEWSGKPWMAEDESEMDRQRLQRIIRDLLGRVTEKVILCHSDLGVNGTEQMGALLPLVQGSKQVIYRGSGIDAEEGRG
ncbi:MAG TPA: recombinase family protein [Xenococcaceae cyanobacterium]